MAHWRSTLDPALYADASELEPGAKAVDWSAIWAGTAAAIAITLLLLALGAGFGLASVSPWPGVGAEEASTFSIGAGIWLIVMQWISSAVGGYLAGRMRTRWHSLHFDETFFRDTAQGLITWSVATIIVAGVAVLMTTLAGLAATDPGAPDMTAAMAEEARKAATTVALFTGFSMLVGAFIACVSAAIGGRLRDRHP